MTATFVQHFGLLVVTAALLACASSHHGERLYAEYSLDASRHPESIDCFYECLRSPREEFQEACFSRCEGVIAIRTPTPCTEGAPTICRSYTVYEPEAETADDETGKVVGEIFGLVIKSAVEAAADDDDDDDDDRKQASSDSPPRRRASPSSSPSRSKPSKSPAKVVVPPSSFGSKLKKR
jgi:hypothetical protein